MTKQFKPSGYNSVSPYIMVKDAKALIKFMENVFNGKLIRMFDHQNKVMHAEVMIDDTIIMLADGGEGFPPSPVSLHVYVEDVDSIYKLALEKGAESIQVPVQKDGEDDKRGGVKDPFDNLWWISTQKIG